MHVESAAVSRIRALELGPTAFRRLALAMLGALFLIVSTGATVRLTASGLGCRHWPGCTAGNPFPEKDYHAFIEFGNRMVGILPIALTLLTWIASRRTPGLPRWTRRLAAALFLGTLAQAPLGYLTVKLDLHPLLVVSHFLLSMAVLGAGVVLAVEALGLERGRAAPLVPLELRRVGLLLAASCLALLVTGTFATAAGPHSGGADIRRLGTLRTSVFVHAGSVAVFGCSLLFVVGYLVARRELAPALARGAGALVLLVLAQMAIGEAQYHTHLPWGLVLVHVAVAAAVWAWTVALVTAFWRPPASIAPHGA